MPRDINRQDQVSILLRVPAKFASRLETIAVLWAAYLEKQARGSGSDAQPWSSLLKLGRTRGAGRATVVKEAMLLGLPLIEAKLQEFEASQKPSRKGEK